MIPIPSTGGGGGGGGTGTVTSVSVTTANGVSGSVATATTTPAISLALGAITPTSVNASGTLIGSNYNPGTGVATFLATPSSANLAAAVTDETGSGSLVFATSPTLVTPVLGAATATSVNGLTITSTTGTLTLTNAKTLSVTNSITLSGTDAQTYTFPATSATIARTDAANTFTGTQTITTLAGTSSITGAAGNMTIVSGTGASRTMTLQTTTSGSTATTFMTADANQNVTISQNLTVNGSSAVLPTTQFSGKISLYNNVSTAGWGVPAVYKAGRVTAQSAANSSISTYTVGAADGSFEVSANMNVTAVTSLVTTLTCTYTDESNTARTMIFPVAQLAGSFIAAGAITGTGAWESPVMHIRCKAATAITILTSTGTFTGVTYTAEGIIKQTA